MTAQERSAILGAYPEIDPDIARQSDERRSVERCDHKPFDEFYHFDSDDQPGQIVKLARLKDLVENREAAEAEDFGHCADPMHDRLIAAMWAHLLPTHSQRLAESDPDYPIIPTQNGATFIEHIPVLNPDWLKAYEVNEQRQKSLRPIEPEGFRIYRANSIIFVISSR